MNEKKKMKFEKKVLSYVKSGIASGELSKAEGNEIVSILCEYRDLVKKGKIEKKTSEEAFQDVLDLHSIKKRH